MSPQHAAGMPSGLTSTPHRKLPGATPRQVKASSDMEWRAMLQKLGFIKKGPILNIQ